MFLSYWYLQVLLLENRGKADCDFCEKQEMQVDAIVVCVTCVKELEMLTTQNICLRRQRWQRARNKQDSSKICVAWSSILWHIQLDDYAFQKVSLTTQLWRCPYKMWCKECEIKNVSSGTFFFFFFSDVDRTIDFLRQMLKGQKRLLSSIFSIKHIKTLNISVITSWKLAIY